MLVRTFLEALYRKLLPKKKIEAIIVFKQSQNSWIWDRVASLAKSNKMDLFPEYAANIEHIAKKMFDDIAGTIQKTSYRHELVDMDAGKVAKLVSSPRQGGILLWELVNMINPHRAIELGSAFGIGTMYMADAMLKNGTGVLDGIEYENWRATLANKALETHRCSIAKVHAGRIEDVLPTLIYKPGLVDFAFVDAVHKYGDCIVYHKLLSGVVTEGATVVYDDINFSPDMLRFWETLIAQPNITDAVLVHGRWGIVRYSTGAELKEE